MTCKAFNSRVISQWLLDCATHADEKSFPASPDRIFGKWLEPEVASGNCIFPTDERLLHQKLALMLGQEGKTSWFNMCNNVFLLVG